MLSVCCLECGCRCYLCYVPHLPTTSFCVSAKPFVPAVKGPSSERQSSPEHGLHVLGSDCLCHGYPQQARTARHPAPSLPRSRGKTLSGSLVFESSRPASFSTAKVPAIETARPNHITHRSFAQLPLSDNTHRVAHDQKEW